MRIHPGGGRSAGGDRWIARGRSPRCWKPNVPEFLGERAIELLKAFRWGKWQTGEFEFAGCELKQRPDNRIPRRSTLTASDR